MSAPKLRLVHGFKPHECIVFGLDPATKSGWSIFVCGKYRMSGTAKNIAERCEAMDSLCGVALDHELQVVAVAEDWSSGNWKSWKAIAAVHEAWGRWDEQLQLSGIRSVVRVKVDTWRSDIFGRTGSRLNRKTTKELAKSRVHSVYRVKASADEAEAILIGEWGCRAAEVAALLAA